MLHSLQAGRLLQKGRGRGLCDLLADASSEKGFKECFSEGEISETSFLKGILCGKRMEPQCFCGKAKEGYIGAALIGRVKVCGKMKKGKKKSHFKSRDGKQQL